MKKVNLNFNGQIGLIFPSKTGIRFTNQTGGVCCNHPSLEGYVVYVCSNTVSKELEESFLTCGEFTKEDANFIESILSKDDSLCNIRVNRNRLNKSQEAWVHVFVSNGTGLKEFLSFQGFQKDKAILTWNNSD